MRVIINGGVKVYVGDNTDVTPSRKEIRDSPSLYEVKQEVRKRDKVCQCCGEQEKQLQVHHIFPLAKYKDLACDKSNMVLLCESCHRRYENRYEECNPVTFAEFMKRNGKR